jgi:hypothetical protein
MNHGAQRKGGATTVEYQSALKRNEALTHATRWMDLKNTNKTQTHNAK